MSRAIVPLRASQCGILSSITLGCAKRSLFYFVLAAILPGTGEEHEGRRGVILHEVSGEPYVDRISETHPAYDPLHFPLLFPSGKQGWQYDLRMLKRQAPPSLPALFVLFPICFLQEIQERKFLFASYNISLESTSMALMICPG